ncbi:hypothetical protein FRC04_001050 [Tulasnella sp. 424]|nr:hypothetical protein FRC04_001050 [Tulasnella sp. 424]KAG8977958.1 hypothetical protein FRC05_000486 [Tulasnella sp. 425]
MSTVVSRDANQTLAALQGPSTELPPDRPVFSTGNVLTLIAVVTFVVLFACWALQIPTRLRQWQSQSRKGALRPLRLPEVADLRQRSQKPQVRPSKSVRASKGAAVELGWGANESPTSIEIETGSMDSRGWNSGPDVRWSRESDGVGLLPYPRTAYVSPAKKRTAVPSILLFRHKDGRPFFASKPPTRSSPGATKTGQISPLFLYNSVAVQPYEKLVSLPFVPSE